MAAHVTLLIVKVGKLIAFIHYFVIVRKGKLGSSLPLCDKLTNLRQRERAATIFQNLGTSLGSPAGADAVYIKFFTAGLQHDAEEGKIVFLSCLLSADSLVPH